MNAILGSSPRPIDKFWMDYADALTDEGITGETASWCRKHVESYLSKTGDVRLKEQVAEDMTHYLAVWVHRTNPSAFVLEQKITALRVLFQHIVKAEWAQTYPWSKWKDPHLHFGDQIEQYSGERGPCRPVVTQEAFKDEAAGFRCREMFSRYFDKLRTATRTKHYSIRTERTYEDWLRRFIVFNDYKDPVLLCAQNVKEYLNYLATVRKVSASSQNQALCALVFFWKEVLGMELGELGEFEYAKKPQRVPTVLSKEEVRRLMDRLEGTPWLMAGLLYGAGLRLMECVRLRVKDVDFERGQILVRDGKGDPPSPKGLRRAGKDRVTTFPPKLIPQFQEHLARVKLIHDTDLAASFGRVYLPYALERKYPKASSEWQWQHVFPATERSVDSQSGQRIAFYSERES